MEDIFVGRVMASPVETVTADTPVTEAAATMADEGIGSVVVVDDSGSLDGILTKTDFVHIVAAEDSVKETPVSEYMSTGVETTTANADLRDAADVMMTHQFHHLPVVDEADNVIGMVTTTDLTAYLSHVQTPSPSAD